MHRRTLSKQSLQGQGRVKLTPEICINNARRLTAVGRKATAADSHSQTCLQNLFFLSIPLMRKQPNYTCMLKNLLKLYCIWTWDTLWVFCFCLVLFYFMHPLWWDNYRTASEAPSPELKAETDTKIIKNETSMHLNLEIFKFYFLFFILFYFILFIYFFFHLLIFNFYSYLYSFYFLFSILSLSL
jgi:hypothetical protein